jgi:hypothetical protein
MKLTLASLCLALALTLPALAQQSDAELDALIPQLSNWGRWGAEDQLGTLNHLTQAHRLKAAGLIRSGRTVSLARSVPMLATNLRDGSYHLKKYFDSPPEEAGCLDNIQMIYHGFSITHVDALCHIFTPSGKNGMYNGFSTDHVTAQGANRLGIEVMADKGIVGRGVLLDIASLRGEQSKVGRNHTFEKSQALSGTYPAVSGLKLGTAIMPADLEAAEEAAGVRVGPGDIVLIRNGAGSANTYQLATGLHPSCLLWLQQRQVAMLGGDSDNDVHPPLPGFSRWSEAVHMIGIPYMGLALLDHAELDALSQACQDEQRWEFFLTIAPWRLKGTTASPVNPLAIF